MKMIAAAHALSLVMGLSLATPAFAQAESALAEGRSLLAAGNAAQAISAFQQALGQDSRSVAALNGIAIAYDRLGRLDLARQHFEKALTLEPDAADIAYNLGWTLHRAGLHREAIPWLQRASGGNDSHAAAAARRALLLVAAALKGGMVSAAPVGAAPVRVAAARTDMAGSGETVLVLPGAVAHPVASPPAVVPAPVARLAGAVPAAPVNARPKPNAAAISQPAPPVTLAVTSAADPVVTTTASASAPVETHRGDAATPACELHVWPAERMTSNTSGWLVGGVVGTLIETAMYAKKDASNTAQISSALDSPSQLDALQSLDLNSLLLLKPGTVIVRHETPLERSTMNKVKARRSDSTASCYQELIVADVFYQKAAIYGRSLNTLFMFRDFGADATIDQQYKAWGGNGLKIFPAKKGEDNVAALNELVAVFKKNFEEYAKNARAAKARRAA